MFYFALAAPTSSRKQLNLYQALSCTHVSSAYSRYLPDHPSSIMNSRKFRKSSHGAIHMRRLTSLTLCTNNPDTINACPEIRKLPHRSMGILIQSVECERCFYPRGNCLRKPKKGLENLFADLLVAVVVAASPANPVECPGGRNISTIATRAKEDGVQ